MPLPLQMTLIFFNGSRRIESRPARDEILIDNERDYLVRLVADNALGISAEWISEKLLFMRFWWGRIAASDFIFDVERETFIYEEMMEYGGIAFQLFRAGCAAETFAELCRCERSQNAK